VPESNEISLFMHAEPAIRSANLSLSQWFEHFISAIPIPEFAQSLLTTSAQKTPQMMGIRYSPWSLLL
jgi:hypothetical protein